VVIQSRDSSRRAAAHREFPQAVAVSGAFPAISPAAGNRRGTFRFDGHRYQAAPYRKAHGAVGAARLLLEQKKRCRQSSGSILRQSVNHELTFWIAQDGYRRKSHTATVSWAFGYSPFVGSCAPRTSTRFVFAGCVGSSPGNVPPTMLVEDGGAGQDVPTHPKDTACVTTELFETVDTGS
jgi:hypothetical protein